MKQDCITYTKDGHCTKFNHLCTNPYANENCYFYNSEKHEQKDATTVILAALRVEVNRLNKRINQIEDEVKVLHNRTIGNRKYFGPGRNDYTIVE